MTIKTLSAAGLLTVLSIGAMPALAQGNAASETYAYGTPLDISQVISLTEDVSQICGLVDAEIIYLNSMGEQRALTYRKQAAVCNDGG